MPDVVNDMHPTLAPGGDLRTSPLFAALDDQAASSLRSSMEELTFHRGDVVFREGDAGDRLYVVASGKVKLVRAVGDGRESLVAVLGPGEVFGEMSLFDPAPRAASATAVSDTVVLSLRGEDFCPWLESNPKVSYHLLGSLARRLRRANEAAGNLVFSDVPSRVAKALLDLSERFGSETDDGLRVAHDLTQEELAQLVGASRETVNKALADFVSRGWIRLESRAVVLRDSARLARRAR